MTTGLSAGTRARPGDRRQQILDAAAQRFRAVGYHQVGMAEIAAAVGIGPSALYRHVRSKQELLLAVLDEDLQRLERLPHGPGLLDAIAVLSLRHRGFGVLWEREAGHLPQDRRREVRHRLRGIARAVAAATPGPDPDELVAWAALSVLDSPSDRRIGVAPARLQQLLRSAAQAAMTTTLPAPTVDADGSTGHDGAGYPSGTPILPASRREALLAAAIRLFGERGYPSIGLADIGAEAGIAGPSVYNHFAGKTELLEAALNRGGEALWLGLHHALGAARTPSGALDRLAADYARFATANTEIVSILVSEIVHLPPERQESFRRPQRAYVAEWTALLLAARDDLTPAEAKVLVHAAIALTNSLARIPHLRSRRGLDTEITRLARAVLASSPGPC